MADSAHGAMALLAQPAVNEQLAGGDGGEGSEMEADGGLTDAQAEVLERCLHALRKAQNDSHTLAALLLVRVSLLLTISLLLGIDLTLYVYLTSVSIDRWLVLVHFFYYYHPFIFSVLR